MHRRHSQHSIRSGSSSRSIFSSHSSRGASSREEKLSKRQKYIVCFVLLTLVWTLWAAAGMYAWAITGTAILSLLSFSYLFLPLRKTDYGYGAPQGGFKDEERQRIFKRLLKFPLFWIGLILFIYIVIQGLNPAYIVDLQNGSWTNTKATGTIEWLPSGMDAPFGFDLYMGMNAWRQLCIFGSAWLLLCTLWCGLRSRKAWEFLIWAFIINALLLALFGIYKNAIGMTSYLWYKHIPFTASFTYCNHAGAFFVLAISLCVALALRIWRHTFIEGLRGGPHLLLTVFALALLGIVFITKSVAAVTLACVWVPFALILILCSGLLTRTSLLVFFIFSLMFAGVGTVWWNTMDTARFSKKVEQKAKVGEIPDIESGLKLEERASDFEPFSLDNGPRADLRRLSEKMHHYNSNVECWGWGAGAYRWIAPNFQRSMPELFMRKNRRTGTYYLPVRTEYAHCDPWQMICEWGKVGAGIFFAGILWFFAYALWNCRYWHVSSVALLGGIVIFMVHSCVDFVSYCPAVLLSVALLMGAFNADLSRRKNLKSH